MTSLPRSMFTEPIPTAGTVIAILGILGSLLGPDWLIAFTGIGLFGPLLLREAGVIGWRDEFQRETTLRASLHAFMAVGILATGTMATQGYGGLHDRMDLIGASTVLWVLALTWGLSMVLQFRPAPDGPFRLLLVYGAVLLTVAATRVVLFGIGSSIDIKNNPPSVLLWAAILTWLLVLIVLCRYFPRTTGWLLLLTATFAAPMLQDWVAYFGGWTRGWTKTIVVLPVAVLPLLATGLALIRTSDRKDEDRETI